MEISLNNTGLHINTLKQWLNITFICLCDDTFRLSKAVVCRQYMYIGGKVRALYYVHWWQSVSTILCTLVAKCEDYITLVAKLGHYIMYIGGKV